MAEEARARVTGNTYPVKDQLKALGGRWDAAEKAWSVPQSRLAEAQALVAGATPPSGMRGELWQACFCGTEPVCVDCERCRKHCRCPA